MNWRSPIISLSRPCLRISHSRFSYGLGVCRWRTRSVQTGTLFSIQDPGTRAYSALKNKMEQLPTLAPVKRLSPRVIRILGDNPSKFTLQGTNTYLVGQGRERILLDTGEGKPKWGESLKQALSDENAVLQTVLLSHWHMDHVGGVADVKQISDEVPRICKNRPTAGMQSIEDGQTFQVEGATLRAVYCPGHTNDHMAFVLVEEDAMFTADNVLGHGTAVYEDLPTYIDSLELMRQKFGGRAYPGHGEVIENGPAKVQEYIQHRKERENQVLQVMKGDAPQGDGEAWRSMSMVKIIYREYPEHLHGPAEGGVVQILDKLQREGRVRKCKDGTWGLTEKAAL